METLLSMQDDHIHVAHTPPSTHEMLSLDGHVDDLHSEQDPFTPDTITQKE